MEFGLTIMNPGEAGYVYILFQRLALTKHCTSVVWKTGMVPPKSSPPLIWTDALCVVLGTKADGRITQGDLWSVTYHTRWSLHYGKESGEDGYSLLQEPDPGTTIEDDVIIENRSGTKVIVGIGMDRIGALYMEDILSNENVIFKMAPTYYLGLLSPDQVVEIGRVVAESDQGGQGGEKGPLTPKDMLASCAVALTPHRTQALANVTVRPDGKPAISISYLA
ncbi:MAG: hypothetical protein KUA35_03945 [Pseudodesulfovibrio sp.]|uniref:Uncharacterized protein n=1 Tax=Pseudodesulfovibrio aespoeensis (strain ATCC 700646 / DSM 10631 / Aspo-2) TaxID=643562 RepID=E6VYX2_PSEA9|nr:MULTISPECIES: hypothetical protein [Pseudodesulfovibrio]MBU4378800.1 hypothetical protein [Pseudomonadota bacterium]MCG2741046.1 hypothetical protein [Syntrophaceae bacterium]ADU61635.1 hypothetical protein Daes_0617 [Pseudodesulfovibrio aespoeensis Aspo-2]MBU4473728.1 hypothetical protein [Pseudomonadota bacterium]MBV1764718.1 hypothetical protein [Pseudodesulfovibrio sp.]